jgi:hypothetical protein
MRQWTSREFRRLSTAAEGVFRLGTDEEAGVAPVGKPESPVSSGLKCVLCARFQVVDRHLDL